MEQIGTWQQGGRLPKIRAAQEGDHIDMTRYLHP
jgi:hypothetical protein